MIKPTSARVRKSEAALKLRGGRRMPGGFLQPQAAQDLADLLEAGYRESAVGVISAALREVRKTFTKE